MLQSKTFNGITPMKTLLLFLTLSLTTSAQQMRDSTYTVDSTASNTTVMIQLTAHQAAALYRTFGVDWREECRSTLVAVARRDGAKEEWDKVQSLSLTAAQKRAVTDELGLVDPRKVQVLKRKSVPVVEQ
jgi:hypothetical protein